MTARSVDVEHVTENDHRGAFVVMHDGERAAEMVYTRAGSGLAIVEHTWVADALRGQGIARTLLDALVAWARKSSVRIVPLCPYARDAFEKDPSIRDVLSA